MAPDQVSICSVSGWNWSTPTGKEILHIPTQELSTGDTSFCDAAHHLVYALTNSSATRPTPRSSPTMGALITGGLQCQPHPHNVQLTKPTAARTTGYREYTDNGTPMVESCPAPHMLKMVRPRLHSRPSRLSHKVRLNSLPRPIC